MWALTMLLALSLAGNAWLAIRLVAIWEGRQRIHNQWGPLAVRVDGKCQCPYCRGDAEDLAELAADYELKLWAAEKKLSERLALAE
jgi:hypothetical protein